MQVNNNMQMQGANNGGSEQASSSDDSLLALRRMIEVAVQQFIGSTMKKEIELMVIHTVEKFMGPTVEDLIRKVVREEIQSAQEKLFTGGIRNYTNKMIMLKERTLQLKFIDEVSLPVLTGKPIQAKGETPLRVALVDKSTREVVNCGPESSAKVEILVLDVSGDDNVSSWSLEDFNNKIIREGDKKKPHFAKSNYIYLKKGVGTLCNAKLGHGSSWMKRRDCRLGARIVENFRGIKVEEAMTESFMVSDSRSTLYGKHYPPSLEDEVWRLENIGKDGGPRDRLEKKANISTVRDFLFLHTIDPQRLQKIVGAGAKTWKDTVKHAQTCPIDDKKIYLYYLSFDLKMGVTFDAVGCLKGVIHDSHYVQIDNLSTGEKMNGRCRHQSLLIQFSQRTEDGAQKLLLSAFENRKDISSFPDETCLLRLFPHRSIDTNAATNSSVQDGPHCHDFTISESIINVYHRTDPGTSSQSVNPFGHENNTETFETIGESDSSVERMNSIGDGSDGVGAIYDSLYKLSPTYHPETLFPDLYNFHQKQKDKFQMLQDGPISYSNSIDQIALRRWNVIVSLLRWRISIKRITIRKNIPPGDIHIRKKQKVC